jgi:hypothetical protein
MTSPTLPLKLARNQAMEPKPDVFSSSSRDSYKTRGFLVGFYKEQKGGHKIVFHSPAQMEDLERWFFDTIISDLLSTPPVLLIVDQTQETKFARLSGLLGYFFQDPRFA